MGVMVPFVPSMVTLAPAEVRDTGTIQNVSKVGQRFHHSFPFGFPAGGGDEWLNASEYRTLPTAFSVV